MIEVICPKCANRGYAVCKEGQRKKKCRNCGIEFVMDIKIHITRKVVIKF